VKDEKIKRNAKMRNEDPRRPLMGTSLQSSVWSWGQRLFQDNRARRGPNCYEKEKKSKAREEVGTRGTGKAKRRSEIGFGK